jgi:hypothetical protein
MGKEPTYTLEASPSRAVALAKQALHFSLDLRLGRIESFQAWIDDNEALRIQPIETDADGLSKPPLKAIPHHGRAKCARNRETDSWARAPFGPLRLTDTKGGEQRAGEPHTLVVHPSKIL